MNRLAVLVAGECLASSGSGGPEVRRVAMGCRAVLCSRLSVWWRFRGGGGGSIMNGFLRLWELKGGLVVTYHSISVVCFRGFPLRPGLHDYLLLHVWCGNAFAPAKFFGNLPDHNVAVGVDSQLTQIGTPRKRP